LDEASADRVANQTRRVVNLKFLHDSSTISFRRFHTDVQSGRKLFSSFTHRNQLHNHSALSDRELEVLRMMASGKTNSQIANVLALSPKTISTYRTRLLEKMGMTTTAELIRYAVENGLVD
jgi:DNA-binding CsgD family transcriptional regulator